MDTIEKLIRMSIPPDGSLQLRPIPEEFVVTPCQHEELRRQIRPAIDRNVAARSASHQTGGFASR